MNHSLVKVLGETFFNREKLFVISRSINCIFMTSKEQSSLKTPVLYNVSIPLPGVVNKFIYAVNLKTHSS